MDNKIWTYYGIAAIFIVFAPMLMSVKQGNMKKLWMGYCLVGVIIGLLSVNNGNKDKNDNNYKRY